MKRSDNIYSFTLRIGYAVLVFVLLVSMARPVHAETTAQTENANDGQIAGLQYSSHGHMLQFSPDGVLLSNGQYAYRVTFDDAQISKPQGSAARQVDESASLSSLDEIQYADLWPGD